MASTSSLSSSFSSFPSSRRASHAPPFSVSFRHPLPSISAVDTIASTTSFYEVLGIQDYATCREIKAAYRNLARTVHPDALVSSDGGRDATSAADEFIRVHEAYATLSDPRKRADYDRMLMFKRRRIGYSPTYAVSSSGFTGSTRRKWETDQCW